MIKNINSSNNLHVPSKIYNKNYYKDHAKGFDWIIERTRNYLSVRKGMKILDLGCGNGDLSIYMAKKGAYVVGIDYSKEAINIANNKLLKENKTLRRNVKFIHTNAMNMNFTDTSFDLVVSIDVFEHVYPYELDKIMKKIRSVLKKNGQLFVHTEANKIYLDIFHKIYIKPMDSLLIKLNKYLTGKDYPGLPKDPRNEYHKVQHVNEPTYFSLVDLFENYGFSGKVIPMGLYKKHLSWKDVIYNIAVLLYPISLIPPLSWFFAYDFICVMKNTYENRGIS